MNARDVVLLVAVGYILGFTVGYWAVRSRTDDASSAPPVGRWRRSTRPSRKSQDLPPTDFDVVEKVTSDEYLAELEYLEAERAKMTKRGIHRGK